MIIKYCPRQICALNIMFMVTNHVPQNRDIPYSFSSEQISEVHFPSTSSSTPVDLFDQNQLLVQKEMKKNLRQNLAPDKVFRPPHMIGLKQHLDQTNLYYPLWLLRTLSSPSSTCSLYDKYNFEQCVNICDKHFQRHSGPRVLTIEHKLI